MSDALPRSDDELDALTAAILHELAQAPAGTGLSLARLGKRLGAGASVLMRRLSMMGSARIGAVDGPGWVRVTREDERWVVALTEDGRAFCDRCVRSLPAEG